MTLLARSKNKHYSTFTVLKSSGRKRLICNPDNVLRRAQYRILKLLEESVEVPDYIHAFEKNKSIPALAELHVGKACVVSFDIKDYFTSITQIMLDRLFMDTFNIGASASRTLSEVCTYKYFVPQGGLTSPKLANLITATTFGPAIKDYCDERGLVYTVYADDITISFPVRSLFIKEEVAELKQFVYETLKSFGFRVNTQKTKVMWTNQRQYVCGVVVNSHTNMKKADRLKLRAIVHNMEKNGIAAEAEKSSMDAASFYSHIHGKVNWYKQLNPVHGGILSDKLKRIYEAHKTSLKESPVNLADI